MISPPPISPAVRRVLVVGGGVAGLSAAIALARIGVEVVVVERDGRADGASIGITNRAVNALEVLGVLDACIAVGVALTGDGTIFSNLRDGAGNPLPIPPPAPRADTRLPSAVSLLRPDLARILLEAAQTAGARIRSPARLLGLDDLGAEVVARLDDGGDERFDLVIGADGVGSQVRGLLFGHAHDPAYTGHMSLRWLLPDGPEGPPGFYVLPDGTMVATTRLPGDLIYVSSGVDMENRRVGPDEARALLAGVLERYSAPFLTALRARIHEGEPVISRPFEWLKLPPPWGRGRVLLIGDAAHATTAHLSSGGSMALEDGVVLAEECAKGGAVEDMLARFVARRAPRTDLVVDASVELLALQGKPEHRMTSAMLRGQAVAALSQPY